jgi:hypothetical protein
MENDVDVVYLRAQVEAMKKDKEAAEEKAAAAEEATAAALQQRDTAVAALDTEKKQKAAVVEELDTEKKEKAVVVEERDTAVAALDTEKKQNAAVVRTSMKATYTTTCRGGKVVARLPAIIINKTVKPCTTATKRKKEDIPCVQIKHCDKKTWVDPKKITIPICDESGVTLLPSELGAKVWENYGGLTYSNEIDVQFFVQSMVNDVIKALGLEYLLKSHMEVALYSMIPDVIVLKMKEGIVFAIEVKAPEHKAGEVFTATPVAGQIWLYLQCMRQHGVERPMGAIMTYNKICLVSLDDLGKHEHHIGIVEKACSELQSPTRATFKMQGPTGKDKCSPSRGTKKLNEINTRYEGILKSADQSVESRVYYSKIFKNNDVYPALLQGLKIAFLDCDPSKMNEVLPVVHHRDNLGSRIFFKMVENGYKVVATPEDLVANAEEFPTPQCKTFYMLTQVGGGKAGYTHLACDYQGRLAAIKLYVPRRSVQAVESKRQKEWQASLVEKIKERTKEYERWRRLYPYYPVFVCTLDYVPGFVMVYGTEIEQKDREVSLIEVKPLLMHFAEAGFKYADEDLRWRHVLRDFEGKLFLGDLESLVPFHNTGTKAINEVVATQVEALRRRIDAETLLHASSGKAAGSARKRKCPPNSDSNPKKRMTLRSSKKTDA